MHRLFRGRCSGCGFSINPHELVRRVYSSTYHLPCFRCVECRHVLQDGNEFYIRDGQIFCRYDHDKEFHIPSFSPKGKLVHRVHRGQPCSPPPSSVLLTQQQCHFFFKNAEFTLNNEHILQLFKNNIALNYKQNTYFINNIALNKKYLLI